LLVVLLVERSSRTWCRWRCSPRSCWFVAYNMGEWREIPGTVAAGLDRPNGLARDVPAHRGRRT
jgi:hypothetical protein